MQEVESPLLKYLLRCKDTVSFNFVQAFLRCGIDVTIKNKVTGHVKKYLVCHSQLGDCRDWLNVGRSGIKFSKFFTY